MTCANCFWCGIDSRKVPKTSVCWNPDSKHSGKCVVGINEECEYHETVLRLTKVRELIAYCRLTCFDKAVGYEWKKSSHFLQLIQDADKEVNKV